ncbi:MAG: PDZ domain-containing protein [Holophagales bacterium]|nr:PDZ domain-containing protein [Holophagales bacterium]
MFRHALALFSALALPWLAAGPGGPAHAQTLPSSELRFPGDRQIVELPFDYRNGLMVVRVEVEGLARPLEMVLDSGSPILVLADPELAGSDRFPVFAQAQVDGIGDGPMQTAPLVRDVVARVAGLEIRNGLMLLGGLDSAKLGVDGVIGRSLFDHAVVEVIWNERRLRVHAPESFSYEGSGARLPLAVGGDRHLETKASLVSRDGKSEKVSLIVDTGARQALGLFLPEGADLPASEPRIADTLVGWGSRGPQWGDVGRVAGLRLGPWDLPGVVTSFVFGPRRSSAEGWIGLPVLRRFRVFFDVPHDRLILEALGGVGDPFVFNSTGLVLAPREPGSPGIPVVEVIPGSPAAAAGIEAGDKILSVQGTAVAELASEALSRFLITPEEGLELSLRISRAGQQASKTLRARHLL